MGLRFRPVGLRFRPVGLRSSFLGLRFRHIRPDQLFPVYSLLISGTRQCRAADGMRQDEAIYLVLIFALFFLKEKIGLVKIKRANILQVASVWMDTNVASQYKAL